MGGLQHLGLFGLGSLTQFPPLLGPLVLGGLELLLVAGHLVIDAFLQRLGAVVITIHRRLALSQNCAQGAIEQSIQHQQQQQKIAELEKQGPIDIDHCHTSSIVFGPEPGRRYTVYRFSRLKNPRERAKRGIATTSQQSCQQSLASSQAFWRFFTRAFRPIGPLRTRRVFA